MGGAATNFEAIKTLKFGTAKCGDLIRVERRLLAWHSGNSSDCGYMWSGQRDLNTRPSAPKEEARTDLLASDRFEQSGKLRSFQGLPESDGV